MTEGGGRGALFTRLCGWYLDVSLPQPITSHTYRGRDCWNLEVAWLPFIPAWYPFTRSQSVRPHNLWGARTSPSGGGLWGRESSCRRHGLLSKGEVGALRPVRLEVGSLRTAVRGQGQHAGLCLGSQGTREGRVPDRSLTGVLKNQSDINWFRSYWVGQTFPTLSLYFLLDVGWS